MAEDGVFPAFLEPPTVTALKGDALAGDFIGRHAMERSFSQDIQEGSQDLKDAAEQTRNIILDLGLDRVIRWVSPSWTDVVGTELNQVKGQKITHFIAGDDPLVFERATEALKNNDSKSTFVKFAIKVGTSSDMAPMIPTDDGQTPNKDNVDVDERGLATLELEGQGIMVYDRSSGGGTHTMWMLQPATEPIRIEIALPQALVETLGVGAEILAKYLTELAEAGANDPENHPPPLPVLCRVCERSIVPWWFEKHSDLCVQEHKAEMDVQMIQESLSEQRHAIVKVLDAFEARQGRHGSESSSPKLTPVPEYKGMSIGPSPTPSSGLSSVSASHAPSPNRSRSPSAAGASHARGRSFVVRRPLVRIVELILDLCDTALEINVPSIKDSKTNSEDEFQSQSPQSESRITQITQWQPPSSLDNEPGLAALSADTERLARAKIDAVHRHQVILEYSERIRQEYMAEVDICINEALHKAARAAAGEPLSSSESDLETEDETVLEGILESPGEEEKATPHVSEPEATRAMPYVGLKSLASALRNPRDLQHTPIHDQRRSSSQAVSTGSNSPIECPTPKSHKSSLISQPQPISNRRSLYIDDANDSDSSLPSSNWRADSPALSDHGRSAHSRDRKRRSMHLHNLTSASPHRQQSPGRYPPPPPSPLRMNKSRVSSAELAQSPIVSPLLTAGEYMPAPHVPVMHRRQSSMHSSDIRTPSSPRLNSIAQPQQRAQPPSIKDFEVVKPISRGAFGSVYLAKKKSTGEYFAIKVLRKSDMVAKNQVTNVKAERAIMMWQGESDFVAKLYWTFSSKDYLYLVMEFLNGGDCASLVKILGGLTEDWAKKYVAEVVLGVEHLHHRGIVHRDLKPDNLLIDSKGHLKLTDFGLSRMGLIGRQKRALKQSEEPAPDLLKQGPFTTHLSGTGSNPTSRSASFDYQGPGSPAPTPLMTPALAGGLDQPSYFSLSKDSSLSRELSWRASGHRSDSGSQSSFDLHNLLSKLALHDSPEVQPLSMSRSHGDDEAHSQGSDSPDLFPLSQSMSNISQAPAPVPLSSQMLPPPTALFDPEESGRRFVGTPDYLAPETINGQGQDEMCDWWSLGCIMFEFLYGYPPFNAETPEEVFDNILHRRIAWPEDDETEVSSEAKDLINKLIQLNPRDRLGANVEEKYSSGGQEIQAHPWFAEINWDTLLEDEAQFIPAPEHPEDTEYFDSRGATLSSFPEELEDQISPSGTTPEGSGYPTRPHDALFRARTQTASVKRGLMPLHIPPHVARDSRSRRLSEPVIADDFGNFTFKNLPVLEKANKDIVEKMRKEAMQAQARGYSHSQAISAANSPAVGSPGPSLEGSPMMPMPVKRALSISKGHRPGSPSSLTTSNSSPSRPSQPSSPLLVQFSTAQHHERRKTSGSSNGSASLLPGSFFDIPHDAVRYANSAANSPIKTSRLPAISPAKVMNVPQRQTSLHGRTRSQTVGSQESDGQPPRENFVPGHHKRKSQLFVRDVSPSSSDNENVQAKALLKVQRRRQSSRRLSQITFLDGPAYRPLDVLICEDHPVSKMVMERLFEKLRCRTVTASNGPDALRLAISQIQFDIIFMEFKLPLISGVDAARMIRDTKSANTNTPLVCITGYLKDLPESHRFDTLMQKPPTTQKLSEMLSKYCSWKPAPKEFKLAPALQIPSIGHRLDRAHAQDSPSSVASSLAPTMPDSSYKGSSREDSIGSGGFFSDLESYRSEDLPVIVSRSATGEWSKGGLGISDEIVMSQKPYVQSGFPHLVHTESAPPTASGDDHGGFGFRTPRRQRSSEAVKLKRNELQRQSENAGAAEEGDDEDEELGDAQVRARSPAGKNVRPTSKLGIEMMRTNSRGSVISMHDDRGGESESLRRSLEVLEERMESLKIPEEPTSQELGSVQPRKQHERSASQHSHPQGELSERPPSRGHITPPVIFPQRPGATVTDIEMDNDMTPVPTRHESES